jgi:HEAT repeat protein
MAAELAGEVRLSGARERLLELLADVDEPARGAAARGLGRLGDTTALPALVAVLEEPGLHEDIRLDVLEGLCHLRTPEAHARVREALPALPLGAERHELEALLEECAAALAGEATR